MAYADQEMSGNRIASIIIVALIHIALGYLLISGLAISAVKEVVERVTTVDVEEEEEPEEEPPPPPPPEQQELPPPPIVAPPPPINLSPPPVVQTVREPPPIQAPNPLPSRTPPPPPPPPPSQARGATPDGQARWTRRIIENYPSRALRREIEGTVGVSVTVGPDGRVAGCRVTRSADPILDEAACDDITRYARFNPALNDAGQPTTGSWATNIVYQIN